MPTLAVARSVSRSSKALDPEKRPTRGITPAGQAGQLASETDMSPSQKHSEPQAQTVIAGRYRLEELRAQGGMAEVWRATDMQFPRTVAVKLLKAHLASDSTMAERFRREAVAAGNLNHFNIVTVHDKIMHNGHQAVIMEYVDGKSLRELLDTNAQLDIGLVLHIGKSVCAALEAAHDMGVIHRDIKPGNILLTKDGRVMITDFGIAKVLDGSEDLTSDNIMMGTAKYLSPEQVLGTTLDTRADLYSLGVVLYEALAGKVPFTGKNDTEIALARLQREPRKITSLRPSVSPQLAAVIHRLLAKDPRDRYRDAQEAHQALIEVSVPPTREPEVVVRPVVDRTPPTGKVIRPKSHTPSGTPSPRAQPKDGSTRGASNRSGSGPSSRSGSSSRPSTRAGSQARTRSRPQTTQRRPSTVAVAIGICILVVIGVLVVQSMRSSKTPDSAPSTNIGDDASAPLITGEPAIMGIMSYDPEGDDKAENESEVSNVTDGDLETAWTTSCYQSATFGTKNGVGLVVQLNDLALAQLQADVGGQNWQARVYAAEEMGRSASQWGEAIWQGSSDSGSTITATFTTPARYALIYFTKVGRSGMCSSRNPYRGSINEVRVTAAP